jgi:hypothetical protein
MDTLRLLVDLSSVLAVPLKLCSKFRLSLFARVLGGFPHLRYVPQVSADQHHCSGYDWPEALQKRPPH